jgi:hypothetical protein
MLRRNHLRPVQRYWGYAPYDGGYSGYWDW